MMTLFLDTASNPNTLALCTDVDTLSLVSLTEKGDAELVPAIEKTLADTILRYEDLTHIACAIGPGGFTSIRVGVSSANALSFALNVPLASIHLSDMWAARVRIRHAKDNADFLWLHSTRKTQLFIRGFGKFAKVYPEPTLVNLEDAKELEGPYVGELIEEHREVLTRCKPLPGERISPLTEVLPAFLRKLSYGKKQILPWYGREG